LTWIIDFQSHLQGLYNGISSSQNYTTEESVYGLEWLFNFAYTSSQQGIIEFKRQTFEFNINNFDILDIYTTVENQIVNEADLHTNLKISNISLNSTIEAGKLLVSSTISFVEYDQNIIDSYPVSTDGEICEGPFVESQTYPLGLDGGDDPIRWPPGCGVPECGPSNRVTGDPAFYAVEELEDNLNYNFRNNSECDETETPFYTDVRELFIAFNWHNINSTCDPYASWNLIDPGACDCLEYEFLNCLYCGLEDAIDLENFNNPPYVVIPEGYEIISVDLAVDRSFTGTPDVNAATAISGFLFYGKPGCRPTPPVINVIPDLPIAIMIEICC